MEESLSEFYLKELESSSNPVSVLALFYKAVFDVKSIDTNTYRIIGRLVKLYGSKNIFMSILDCADVDNIDVTSVHRLITYFAKKRLMEKVNKNPINNLDDMIKKNLSEMERKRRLKIPEPFGDTDE